MTPACCCGGLAPPKPGPPGTISGQVLFPDSIARGPYAVYAVDADAMGYDGRAPYVMGRLDATQTAYALSVPPGDYYVVARLDSKPLSGAGHTFDVGCGTNCGANAGNSRLVLVRVESMQAATNVDVGDWGSVDALRALWQIDVHGAPVEVKPAPSRSVPMRSLPAASTELPIEFSQPNPGGYRLHLPPSWGPAGHALGNDDSYFANERVDSPLQLDANGVWLTARWYGDFCPGVDWRYPTDLARVQMQGGPVDFYFEDPSGPLLTQPFAGYVLRGSRPEFGNCMAFIFTGATEQALESNLADINGILSSAEFYKPAN